MALWSVIALCMPMISAPVQAQAPAGGANASAPARAWSEAELDSLVASIALYPDDLLALVLPASTYPLDIVKADRFLERLKSNKDLKPDESLNESVRNLLNYPEIVRKMSSDLDWTQQLGNAVVDDQGAVMEAVQRFRRKAYAAKNLKTDDKQTVVVEDEVISLQPTKPDVIYVPQYDPAVIVVEQPTSVVYGSYWGYYPTPYPVYYYPYPPGYAFASGFFWGAVGAAWAMNWGGHHVEHNVNINNNTNINRGDGNRGQGNRGDRNQVNPNDRGRSSDRGGRTADRGTGGERWQPDRGGNRQGGGDRPAQRSQGGARPGDRSYSPRTASTFERGQAASQFNRAASTGSTGNRGNAGASASTRPSNTGASNRAGSSSANRSSSNRSSYGGSSRSASSRGGGSMSRYSSGRSASAASSRGAGSRGGGGRGGGGRGRR